jgi:hypothetical protein
MTAIKAAIPLSMRAMAVTWHGVGRGNLGAADIVQNSAPTGGAQL